MNTTVKRLPAEVFHPSEYIRDEMEARDWTVAQVAVMMGVSESRAQDVIDGKMRVTPMIAVELSRTFQTSASLWYRMQRTFDAGPASPLPGVDPRSKR